MERVHLMMLALAALASVAIAAAVQPTPTLLSASQRAKPYGLVQGQFLTTQADGALSR